LNMDTLQIDILNPKAVKLLKDLEDLNLISIRESSDNGFLKLVNKIRAKAKDSPPSLDEITEEIELVRASRYAKPKG
jgi:hypothetical protein